MTEYANPAFGQNVHLPRFQLHARELDWIESIECQREICAIRKRLTKLPYKRIRMI